MLQFLVNFKDDLPLANEVLGNISNCSKEFDSSLYKLNLSKHDGLWMLQVNADYIDRNDKEVKEIFDGNKVNILSKLFSVDFSYKETTKTKITSKGVTPVVEYSLVVPKGLENFIDSVQFIIEERHNDFPYVKEETLSNIKPNDTWLSFLKRLSIQTQQSVFIAMICDMTAYDSVMFASLQTGAYDEFIFTEMVREEHVDFFKYMMSKTSLVDKEKVYETIINNAKRVEALNKILIDSLVSTLTSN